MLACAPRGLPPILRLVRSKFGLAVLAFVVSFHPWRPALASIVEAMSLADLVRASDVVVVARVEGQRARYDEHGRIVTDVSVRIEESMHGRLARSAQATVLRLGGVVGDLGLRVDGEPSYVDGERIVLFARWSGPTGHEVLRPVGMSQGVLPIDEAAGLVRPGGAGLELVTPGDDGRLRPAAPAFSVPQPFETLLRRIRELVAEIHGRGR